MITSLIDLSQFVDLGLFTPEQLNGLMNNAIQVVTNEVYRKIIELSNELKSTRGEYQRNLSVEFGEYTSLIVLKGDLPLALENGKGAFDMKEGFSKSSKRKTTKDGWYLTVPFRWGVPTSIGEEFSNRMPSDIYSLAKNKANYISGTPQGDVKNNAILSSVTITNLEQIDALKGTSYSQRLTRAGAGEWGSYTHKAPIYQGIVKVQKTYERATQSQYMSFRRVSNKSDKNSWIHKGFQARNYMDKALGSTNVDALVEHSIAKIFESLE